MKTHTLTRRGQSQVSCSDSSLPSSPEQCCQNECVEFLTPNSTESFMETETICSGAGAKSELRLLLLQTQPTAFVSPAATSHLNPGLIGSSSSDPEELCLSERLTAASSVTGSRWNYGGTRPTSEELCQLSNEPGCVGKPVRLRSNKQPWWVHPEARHEGTSWLSDRRSKSLKASLTVLFLFGFFLNLYDWTIAQLNSEFWFH